MVRPHDIVVSLFDVDRNDSLYVGGKGANLGEMLKAGFPVPPGFVVTANAYFEFLTENQLENKISHLLSTINFDREDSLNQVSNHIQKLIRSARVPEKIASTIFDFYSNLGSPLVAVRSSATSEDSKAASFAGQNETFLNIKGDAHLIEKIREAWSSLFEPRSIFYRHDRKIGSKKNAIALVVQKMIESDSSGVMFTIDPVTNEKSKIIIEAIFGLGEYIVQGKVTPDHYEIDKKTLTISKKIKNSQDVMLKKAGNADKQVRVPLLKRKIQKIKDDEILELAKLGREIEKHYYFPQDIEWAKEKNKIYIVQTRPVTTTGARIKDIGSQTKRNIQYQTSNIKHPILIGDPASPGIGVGKVFRLVDTKDRGKKMEKGAVLVAQATNPDYVPAMRKAAAIITEKGGRTSHAAIVAREFGIPAVVGAIGALSKLNSQEIVTVNGKTGEVFKGGFLGKRQSVNESLSVKTATKVLVNLAEPELAEEIAQRNVDGIGLLRAEFMIAQIGIHPKKLIKDRKSDVFVEKLARGIGKICQAFYPRPVLYRATDFKTNEYRSLIGGGQFEPDESNPMLGYRGAFRYIHDPATFKLEIKAIKRVREKMSLNNLNLMIPFVRTVHELEEVKKIILNEKLARSHTFKLYMMVEIPSNVILIEDFIKSGVDGVSIGSNDLTMLTLGIDRDNEEVSSEFDERNKALMWSYERVIKTCRKNHVTVSICGQAPSLYPGLVEDLVLYGIDSISVSADAIDNTRRMIYAAEERVVNKK